MIINLALTPEQFANLRQLIAAGAKSPYTNEDAIMAAAEFLQLMARAAQAAQTQTTAPKLHVVPGETANA